MISCPSQTGFPRSSTSANLGDRSFAPPSGTYIANSRNGNTATHPFGVAAGPSSHASMSIQTTTYSSGVSNGSEPASTHSFSTYEHLAQFNGAVIDNAARPRFPTAEFVIPMVPGNAPSPQSTYTPLPAINTNQYMGDPFHNTPSLRSSTYRNMVTGNNLSSSSSLQMYVYHHHLRVAISLTSTLHTGLMYRNMSHPTQILRPPTPTLNHSPMVLGCSMARNQLALHISQRRLWHPHHLPTYNKICLPVIHTLAQVLGVVVKVVHRTLTPRRPLHYLAIGLTKTIRSAHFKGHWMIWGSISRAVICQALKMR
jgi:hypothetical protein